ncbi:MarR family winged helix-turn-helix transcriptional regulator [Novosphingobium jiangmenense]|uniref:Winged helix-turn-helix transcriptional regulator n=1 Tax=Novosphingobium jiangmenense TaxID=2791981 RepID=A0ABS0HBD5_9SPHN|nr:MarR family winged helix-turn-helix transcriptional regulator [Novosphingobium jiangmenense]MBF9149579.1 winged helix-turn-helix transcriptional regulator [Novosphingobium jiangmenense]
MSRAMRHPLDPMLGFHLVRTANLALRAVNAAYGDLGIRHPDGAVLLVIDANPGITQSSIGRLLNIQRSNIAPMVSRLVDRGWLERRPGKGKTIGMFLTESGQRIMPAIHAASTAGENMITTSIGADAYAATLETLKRLR